MTTSHQDVPALLGIAGEIKPDNPKGIAAALAGLRPPPQAPGMVGIAGLNMRQTWSSAESALGLAGNLSRQNHRRIETDYLVAAAELRHRDRATGRIIERSRRIGDIAPRQSWKRGCWMADITNLVTPFARTERGGQSYTGSLRWKDGREEIFSPAARSLPLTMDSSGYRRAVAATKQRAQGNAAKGKSAKRLPDWVQERRFWYEAIALVRPDSAAAFDYPLSLQQTLAALREHIDVFGWSQVQELIWPVFPTIAADAEIFDQTPKVDWSRVPPGWRPGALTRLIPLMTGLRQNKPETVEQWAMVAVAAAQKLADHPDFRWMAAQFGRVMIGGLVAEPPAIRRVVRHLFAAVLCHHFPGVHFWLLGCASAPVINGLNVLNLLDRVWTDGSSWIAQATLCDSVAVVKDGLIDFLQLKAGNDGSGAPRFQLIMETPAMMASHIIAMLAAYDGLIKVPHDVPLMPDPRDRAALDFIADHYTQAALDLGL